jgi:triosephosphate isomerase
MSRKPLIAGNWKMNLNHDRFGSEDRLLAAG